LYFFPFFFCVIGVWTQGIGFDRQVLCHLSHASNPCCFRYFSNRVLRLCSTSLRPWSSCLCFPCSWDDRYTLPHPALIGCNGISWNFFLSGLAWNLHLPDLCFLSSLDYNHEPRCKDIYKYESERNNCFLIFLVITSKWNCISNKFGSMANAAHCRATF
jgi:hypothetical protein